MAEREFYIGSHGPFLYNDTNTYGDGTAHQGIYAETGKITSTPTDVDDIPNKLYVDDMVGAVHDAVTLDSDADNILTLSTQELGLLSQSYGTVFAGPATPPGVYEFDNFDRTDSDSLGANWTESEKTVATRIKIVTNRLYLGDSLDVGIAIHTGSFDGNQYSQAEFVSRAGGPCGGPAVRMSGAWNNLSCYVCYNDATTLYIRKFVNESLPTSGGGTLLATHGHTLVTGDVVKIEAAGDVISVYVEGALEFQTTDISLTTGSPGMVANGWNSYWDDWTGADVAYGTGIPSFRVITDTDLPDPIDLGVTTVDSFELNTVVWDDLRITPGSFDRPGISDPAIVAYDVNGGGTSTYLWEFDKNDIASFTVQLPHGYKEGENILVHIHWTPGARGNEENGNTVGWKIDYSWADINGNFGTMSTADLSDACDGTDHKHQMTPQVVITGSGKHISSMLLCNVKRTDTGTDDTWSSTTTGQLPMLLEIDFHFPIDTIGSTTSTGK